MAWASRGVDALVFAKGRRAHAPRILASMAGVACETAGAAMVGIRRQFHATAAAVGGAEYAIRDQRCLPDTAQTEDRQQLSVIW